MQVCVRASGVASKRTRNGQTIFWFFFFVFLFFSGRQEQLASGKKAWRKPVIDWLSAGLIYGAGVNARKKSESLKTRDEEDETMAEKKEKEVDKESRRKKRRRRKERNKGRRWKSRR